MEAKRLNKAKTEVTEITPANPDEAVNLGDGEHTRAAREQKVIQKIMREYDWRVRPRGSGDPRLKGGGDSDAVFVRVNMYLRTISKVDDVNMEYSAHFTFREEWNDTRLRYNEPGIKFINLPPNDPLIQIWMPDTFFQNEKEGRRHDIDKPNVLLRVSPDGQILYSVRMTLMLSCPMNLQNYPMDIQQCFIDLASYAYTTNDIIYYWKDVMPVQIKAGLRQSLPSFKLNEVFTQDCSHNTSTGEYSCLRTVLNLKREFSYYLLQLYIPSFMLVAVSWVSFWLDKDSVPARVTLGVTTLLTMTTQASGINAKLPPVSYTKAIDVWIGVCLAFIFGALLEFALVNYAARQDMLDEIKARQEDPDVQLNGKQQRLDHVIDQLQRDTEYPLLPVGSKRRIIAKTVGGHRRMVSNVGSHGHRRLPICRWFVNKYRDRSKRIDVLARFAFPVAFAMFNVLYWCTYLLPYMQAVPDNALQQ